MFHRTRLLLLPRALKACQESCKGRGGKGGEGDGRREGGRGWHKSRFCCCCCLLRPGPPPCAPANGRPGFPFGFLGAGGRLPKARRGRIFIADPPPCAPANGRPGFPFGFLGAGGRLPKARRGRVFIVQFTIIHQADFFFKS